MQPTFVSDNFYLTIFGTVIALVQVSNSGGAQSDFVEPFWRYAC